MNLAFLHLHWGGGTYKGKKYKSYSLARSVRKNGKNSHKVEVKLGKLNSDEVRWWRNLLHAIKNPSSVITTFENIVTRIHYEYCALATVNKFWDYWKLDNAFLEANENNEIPLKTIVRILTINRCVEPESKSAVPEWLQKTALPHQLDIPADKINKSRIFRELNYIEKNKENICNHLLSEYKQKFGGSLNRVYYDLSSTTFSGTKCIISKYGHCKEGFRTHVVLALLVTESGLPFYWEILPGGTADATTVEWLLKKCKSKFKELNITTVFDRGFVSDDNLDRFDHEGIKYISAMDRDQLGKICGTQVDFEKYAEFSPENIDTEIDIDATFTKINSTTYYREIKVKNIRRYILCFNPQLFIDQRRAREKSIELFKNEILPELNDELKNAQKSRSYEMTLNKFKKQLAKCKISSFVEVKLNPLVVENGGRKINSFQGQMYINEQKKKKMIKMDGFWMLVTNLSEKNNHKEFIVSSEDALRPYREKVIIEDAFRDIKSFIEIAPVYVRQENHIKAHYTICVLSYLINRTISNLLKENPGKLSEDIKTHCAVYKELSGCSIDEIYIKNLGQSNYCMTELSEKQKEILKRLKVSDIANANEILNKLRGNIAHQIN